MKFLVWVGAVLFIAGLFYAIREDGRAAAPCAEVGR